MQLHTPGRSPVVKDTGWVNDERLISQGRPGGDGGEPSTAPPGTGGRCGRPSQTPGRGRPELLRSSAGLGRPWRPVVVATARCRLRKRQVPQPREMTLREKGAHGDARARLGLCGPGKRNAPLKFTSVTKLQKSSTILDARGANAALPPLPPHLPHPGPRVRLSADNFLCLYVHECTYENIIFAFFACEAVPCACVCVCVCAHTAFHLPL